MVISGIKMPVSHSLAELEKVMYEALKDRMGVYRSEPYFLELVPKGIDKAQVGEFAAKIRKVRPPEPYKGKGIRYKDEYVRAFKSADLAGGNYNITKLNLLIDHLLDQWNNARPI